MEEFICPEFAKGLGLIIPKGKVRLGQLPTPLLRWDESSAGGLKKSVLPEGAMVEMWVKRDDLSGLELSGNKVRKLEFLLAEALEQGMDTVVTIGGIQSNHCRATAAAARQVGLQSQLILRTTQAEVDKDPGLQGNLLFSRLMNADISLVSKADYGRLGSEKLLELERVKLQSKGLNPYCIPVGGSNALGTWGYLMAVLEIKEQFESRAVPFPDVFILSAGSGGTALGIALGVYLLDLPCEVVGYCVCDDPDYFYDYMDEILINMRSKVGEQLFSFMIMYWRFIVDLKNEQEPHQEQNRKPFPEHSRDLIEIRQARGAGYAISRSEEIDLLVDVASASGLIFDPVYTGKALKGFLDDLKLEIENVNSSSSTTGFNGKRVLFLHSGGAFGAYKDEATILSSLAKKGYSKVTKTIE